jgi:hypothetical protein
VRRSSNVSEPAKAREKTFGMGRLSVFKFEPNLDDVEATLMGKIQPRVGDVVKPSPSEVQDGRSQNR